MLFNMKDTKKISIVIEGYFRDKRDYILDGELGELNKNVELNHYNDNIFC